MCGGPDEAAVVVFGAVVVRVAATGVVRGTFVAMLRGGAVVASVVAVDVVAAEVATVVVEAGRGVESGVAAGDERLRVRGLVISLVGEFRAALVNVALEMAAPRTTRKYLADVG